MHANMMYVKRQREGVVETVSAIDEAASATDGLGSVDLSYTKIHLVRFARFSMTLSSNCLRLMAASIS